MIGCHSLLVKENCRYSLHQFSGIAFHIMYREMDKEEQYSRMIQNIKTWGKFDDDNIPEEEVLLIARAKTNDIKCTPKKGYAYHKYAADGVYLLDCDKKTLECFDQDKDCWCQL